eukprot:m.1215935 g.1215935  ORF g.1215935 m.1215935 type:complete len:60 (+) comp24612_c1_seq37:3113-3292(+)
MRTSTVLFVAKVATVPVYAELKQMVMDEYVVLRVYDEEKNAAAQNYSSAQRYPESTSFL